MHALVYKYINLYICVYIQQHFPRPASAAAGPIADRHGPAECSHDIPSTVPWLRRGKDENAINRFLMAYGVSDILAIAADHRLLYSFRRTAKLHENTDPIPIFALKWNKCLIVERMAW